ncbi:MAG: ABC transporter ATP-binding protein [Proteobacteria bacterium]|nr:ABC transporter ATP-binding protein [Pseudomonadota bacterium]
MANPLLEIDQLSVSLQKRKQTLKAVDNLSLKIYSGEILGLVGESGAGKSMTGSAILGLIDPPLFISSGKIIFEGERIDQNTKNIRGSKISMIFQDPLVSLNPLRRIGDQLVETIITHFDVSKTQAFERAKSLLEEVGIDPSRINAYPHTFSGGMRQRVVIALALAPEPALIIADEPTTALDVSVQAQILDLLKKLAKERGTAIILITHDMGVIAETTDRVAVLYSGRLAEIGKTADVLKDPKHPYTKGLVASTPRIDANSLLEKLFQIPGAMPDLDNIPEGCPFHPRCDFADAQCRKEQPPLFQNRSACWLSKD